MPDLSSWVAAYGLWGVALAAFLALVAALTEACDSSQCAQDAGAAFVQEQSAGPVDALREHHSRIGDRQHRDHGDPRGPGPIKSAQA